MNGGYVSLSLSINQSLTDISLGLIWSDIKKKDQWCWPIKLVLQDSDMVNISHSPKTLWKSESPCWPPIILGSIYSHPQNLQLWIPGRDRGRVLGSLRGRGEELGNELVLSYLEYFVLSTLSSLRSGLIRGVQTP